MPIPISYTAVLSAILRTTGDPVRIVPAQGNELAHHVTPTNLELKDAQGEPFSVPLESLSLTLESDLLRRDRTVHLSGPFGQNPTSFEAFLKHSPLTQSDLSSSAPDPKEIAGKATISGTAKVLNVSLALIDNLNDDNEQWHLTVDAEHKVFDPKAKKVINFVIEYRFGHFSPPLDAVKDIKKGCSIYFQGILSSQNPITKRFIVQVMQHDLIAYKHQNVNVVWVE